MPTLKEMNVPPEILNKGREFLVHMLVCVGKIPVTELFMKEIADGDHDDSPFVFSFVIGAMTERGLLKDFTIEEPNVNHKSVP